MASNEEHYQPPPGPPPKLQPQTSGSAAQKTPVAPRRSLIPQPLPYEQVDSNYGVQSQGWTVLDLHKGKPIQQRDSRHESAQDAEDPRKSNADRRRPSTTEVNSVVWDNLFKSAKKFFDNADDFKAKFGRDDSEEGWSKIEGEKELITIRRKGSQYCPDELESDAERAWESVFGILSDCLECLEPQLGVEHGALTRYVDKSLHLTSTRRASMLRIFRYLNHQEKVVAEQHRDLGLLSLVIGDRPGLEVWNRDTTNSGKKGAWIPIEKTYTYGQATLLCGRQLEHLTNSTLNAAAHRVVAYGTKCPPISDIAPTRSKTKRIVDKWSHVTGKRNPKYRFSMVFVMRADEVVNVDYGMLRGPVTGLDWKGNGPEGETAGELFERIRKAHYNINTHVHIRQEQKKKLGPLPVLSEGRGRVDGRSKGEGVEDKLGKVGEEGSG